MPKFTPGTTPTSAFLCTIFRDSGKTPASPLKSKARHPAMDSLVLYLQCVKWTAVFVIFKHRDFVAGVWKCGSRSLDLFVLILWPSFFYCYIDEQSVLVRTNTFWKISTMVTIFLWSSSTSTLKQCFLSTFLCCFMHVSSSLRRRRHASRSPRPQNTFPAWKHEPMVNLRRILQRFPPRLQPWKLPQLAAWLLELT